MCENISALRHEAEWSNLKVPCGKEKESRNSLHTVLGIIIFMYHVGKASRKEDKCYSTTRYKDAELEYQTLHMQHIRKRETFYIKLASPAAIGRSAHNRYVLASEHCIY